MANKRHLARLKQGKEAWKAWREKNPGIRPNLYEAHLREEDLGGADLHEADLHEADLTGAKLDGANLDLANLARADLTGADLSVADLTGANLTGADLIEANLGDANLARADLTGANLRGAKLTRAHLGDADLTRAHLGGNTTWGNVDLSSVRGLEMVHHHGPSTIGIDTLYRSHGNIPEAFLRGAGVPDEMITHSKSLVRQPSRYYSCFISYSSRDEELARRLHADLQDKGVRCWFAPEEVKIGDEFRSRIDELIQMSERLLLILSEDSVKSRWVQKEVETAFEKEGKENRSVLFPIRIDEAVMRSTVGWAADIRRQRHIGDFQQWKDDDAYQQAFQRLLEDLKINI